jgi:hypothetical protein
MLAYLRGKKTYVTLGMAASAYLAFLVGVITREQLESILIGLGIPAAGFLRSAIDHQPDKVLEQVAEVKREVRDVQLDVQATLPVRRER